MAADQYKVFNHSTLQDYLSVYLNQEQLIYFYLHVDAPMYIQNPYI